MSVRIFSHRFCHSSQAHPCRTSDGIEHQEAPSRLESMKARLQGSKFSITETSVLTTVASESARLEKDVIEVVLSVHDPAYISRLKQVCAEAPAKSSVPLTPRLIDKETPFGSTLISRNSFVTALAAVWTCLQAADAIVDESESRVFCLVRPPGHHAGISFPDPKVGGCGFCLLNTAAIAATYVRRHFERVAVVDLDVHHGNGTEECLRKLGKGYMYASVHLCEVFPDNPDKDFFPGTGLSNEGAETECIVVSCPIQPLWVKESSQKRSKVDAGRQCFVQAVKKVIIPALQLFNPQVIILSCGFDGAHGDEGNLSEDGTQIGLDLTTDDFREMAISLRETCPKIISILEGGYGILDTGTSRYDRTILVDAFLGHLEGLSSS